MTALSGRFTEAVMTGLMHHIAEELGVTGSDAQLLHLTNNAVYALPAAGLVIRITRSYGLQDRVRKVVRLATYFERVDAPTIRLAPDVDQPVQADGLLATIWRYVPPTPPKPKVEDLGAVLRRFHSLEPPKGSIPSWDPVDDALRRLDDAPALSNSDRDFLLQWCERLAPRIADLNLRADKRLIHADAHVGNLLRQPDGRVVLCDFDATCVGPWQVDLVAEAVGEARFGRAGAHQALAAAYGYDVTTDPNWQLLREARELKMVIGGVPLLGTAPGITEEFAVRLKSVQHNDPSTRWTPFAALRK